MSLSLPIPEYITSRRVIRSTVTARVVPARTFVLPVTWEETTTKPTPVPLRINPASDASVRHANTITRLKIPLELRLDPTL